MIFLTNNEPMQATYVIYRALLIAEYQVNSMISNGTIWFILAGVIIIIVAIIFAVKKRKKTKK